MRTAPAIAVTVATLLLSASLAPAAQAVDTLPEPVCTLSNAKVDKPVVTIGPGVRPGAEVVNVKVTVDAKDCQQMGAYIEFGAYSVSTEVDPVNEENTKWAGTIRIDAFYLWENYAGTMPGVALIDGEEVPLGTSLTLKQKTALKTSAPSKVKKNKSFSVGAELTRAGWDSWTSRYVYHWDQKLRLQSRPAGGTYKTIKTLNTGDDSWGVHQNLKITKYTCYRWVYDGSRTTAPVTSKTSCVNITK